MIAFFGALLLAVTAAGYTAARRRGGYAVAFASLAAFVVAIAGVLSFLSLYVYEHPHHHCPFCVLKAEYGHQGYLLYIPLFVATACGLAVGAVQPFAAVASLRDIVPTVSGRLSRLAAIGFALFAAIATFIIFHSNLILIDHKSALFSHVGMALATLSAVPGGSL